MRLEYPGGVLCSPNSCARNNLRRVFRMAAVTADTLVLPRVKAASLGDTERPVLSISTGPTGYEGEGFPVRRTMAGIPYKYTDPFIMMDQMGEVEYAAGEPRGTSW